MCKTHCFPFKKEHSKSVFRKPTEVAGLNFEPSDMTIILILSSFENTEKKNNDMILLLMGNSSVTKILQKLISQLLQCVTCV